MAGEPMTADLRQQWRTFLESELEDWIVDYAEETKIVAFLSRVRSEALESAAKECDDEVRKQPHVPEDPSDETSRSVGKSAAAKCAWRIRALDPMGAPGR
jgi:hypothetical protein